MLNTIRRLYPSIQKPLSRKQVSLFHNRGNLLLQNVLPRDILDPIKQSLERWVDGIIANWIERLFIVEDFSQFDFSTRLYQAWIASGKPSFSTEVHLPGAELRNFTMHDNLVQILRQLLDAHTVLPIEGSFFRAKLPEQDATSIPWHQDAQCISPITDADFVTLWIPLVDVNGGNSCLEIADVKRNRAMYERCFPPGAPYVGMKERDIRNLTNKRKVAMQCGDILCMHKYLPHRSIHNVSKTIRWSIDLRYLKAE